MKHRDELQTLLTRQEDQFGKLIFAQIEAIMDSGVLLKQASILWENFDLAYKLGQRHRGEIMERRIRRIGNN